MTPAGADEYAAILAHLRRATGVDVAAYKPHVVRRRVQHRMVLAGQPTPAAYAALLAADPAEVGRLLTAVLIKTTAWFRDAATFRVLRATALPALVARIAAAGRRDVRAWVAGCSTGEEAYSLAMCLREATEAAGADLAPCVLASDVDERAVALATTASYPAPAAGVPPALAARWLVPEASGVRVAAAARECVAVVRHDVLDPARAAPREAVLASFDVVVCCNVMIYLTPAGQARVLERLTAACEPGSVLVLGESERLSGAVHRGFVAVDPAAPVYVAV